MAVDANSLLRDRVSHLKKQLRTMEIKYGELEDKNYSVLFIRESLFCLESFFPFLSVRKVIMSILEMLLWLVITW